MQRIYNCKLELYIRKYNIYKIQMRRVPQMLYISFKKGC